MIEKFSRTFPLEPLVAEAKRVMKEFPLSSAQRPGLKGWAIQSASGDLFDGFGGWDLRKGDLTQKAEGWQFDLARAAASQYKIDLLHGTPTKICRGAFANFLQELQTLSLHPRRMRLSVMMPGEKIPPHVDGGEDDYCVRLQMALLTNPGALLTVGSETLHLPADGTLHFFSAKEVHSAVNEGPEPRLHLIASVWDTKGITKNFPCPPTAWQQENKKAERYESALAWLRDRA